MTTPMMTMTPQHSASDEGRHRQLACRQSSDDEDPGREVNVVTTHKKGRAGNCEGPFYEPSLFRTQHGHRTVAD
jgi:hypothetical protein